MAEEQFNLTYDLDRDDIIALSSFHWASNACRGWIVYPLAAFIGIILGLLAGFALFIGLHVSGNSPNPIMTGLLFVSGAFLGAAFGMLLMKLLDKGKLVGKLSILVSRDSKHKVLSIEQHKLLGECTLIADQDGIAVTNWDGRSTMKWADTTMMSVTNQHIFLKSDFVMVIPLHAFPTNRIFLDFLLLAKGSIQGGKWAKG